MLVQRFLVYSYQPESQRVGCCRRNLLRPSGDFPKTAPKCFACEGIYFACDTILFRRAARKLLKSLGREMCDFVVSCDFKGLRPIFFALSFSPSVFGSRPSGPSPNFVSQDSSIARIRFQGKPKGESLVGQFEFRFHPHNPRDWRGRNAPILPVQPEVAATPKQTFRRRAGSTAWAGGRSLSSSRRNDGCR